MNKQEAPLERLNSFLPRGAYPHAVWYLNRHKVHLTITRERKSILGNYQRARNGRNHRISVNGNLNKYAFLITLIHELAHLLTYEKYGSRTPAHGIEWKMEYGRLLSNFISHRLFPSDIEEELLKTLKNPAASSGSEESLMRALRRYDPPKPGFFLLEELPEKSVFRTSDGTLFKKNYQKRKRILCTEARTRKQYLFSPVTEVQLVRQA